MSKLKTLLLCIFVFVLLIGCSTSKETTSTFGFSPESIQKISKDTLTLVQVDSIINVDKLKPFNTWKKTELTDYETNVTYKISLFYKALTRTTYTIRLLPNKLYVVEKKKF